MEILLARGADPKATDTDRIQLLDAAYANRNLEVRRVVHDAGVPLANANALMAPVLVANQHDAATVTRLLDAGVPADRQLGLITFSLPVSFVAAHESAADTLRLFLDRGLNPNASGAHGITPLMLAATGERPGALKTLDMLIKAGADPAAQDESGRTALDWALTRGETKAAQMLRAAGAKSQYVPPAAPRPITAHTPTMAVEKAISRLQPAGPAFYERTKCASCHNQSLPGVAVTLASRRGVKVDTTLSDHSITTIRSGWKNRREDFLLATSFGGGFVPNAIYGLFDLAEAEMPADTVTDVLVLTLASDKRRTAAGSGARAFDRRSTQQGSLPPPWRVVVSSPISRRDARRRWRTASTARGSSYWRRPLRIRRTRCFACWDCSGPARHAAKWCGPRRACSRCNAPTVVGRNGRQ